MVQWKGLPMLQNIGSESSIAGAMFHVEIFLGPEKYVKPLPVRKCKNLLELDSKIDENEYVGTFDRCFKTFR